jgi:6-phosphogluconate dehydrogenase
MLPAGAVDDELATLVPLLDSGDTVVDGGNSHYHGDIRRAKELKPRHINYVDVGTSGGVWGIEQGYCLMIGGDADVVRRLDPIFAALAPGIDAAPRTEGHQRLGGTAEQGLPALWVERRRPLRQDGSQRHRVRSYGRLR